MKQIIKIVAVTLTFLILSAVMLSAQEHKDMHKDKNMKQMMDSKKIDINNDGIIYQCPMKCEASDKPGECSKCGMKLIEVSLNISTKTAKCEGKEKVCCNDKAGMENKKDIMEKHDEKMQNMKMDHKNMYNSKMENSIVRNGVIDVKSLDKNNDGKVFQDTMDWNVVSDKAGKCPVCGMTLKEVSIEQAVKNLNTNGFKTK